MAHPNSKLPIEERFLEKVIKTDGCWIWASSKNNDGYGHFRFGGKMVRAHRASYHLFRGEIPEGCVIAHKCDNPGCVNPDHLIACGQFENVQDCYVKGRTGRGEKNRHAKLKEKDVLAIKALILNGKNNTEIAKMFPIDRSVVSRIRNGRTWSFVKDVAD
jgi:hypothetical protein